MYISICTVGDELNQSKPRYLGVVLRSNLYTCIIFMITTDLRLEEISRKDRRVEGKDGEWEEEDWVREGRGGCCSVGFYYVQLQGRTSLYCIKAHRHAKEQFIWKNKHVILIHKAEQTSYGTWTVNHIPIYNILFN